MYHNLTFERGTWKWTTWGSKVWVSHITSWKRKLLVSTYATTSRIIRWSPRWKQVINAWVIKVQHPKKVGATNRTIERRPNPFEKIGEMTWWQAKWPTIEAKDSTPNNFSNIIMVHEKNLTKCYNTPRDGNRIHGK